MNKNIIIIGILIIGAIILFFGKNIYFNIKYLQGKSQYNYLPRDIQQIIIYQEIYNKNIAPR